MKNFNTTIKFAIISTYDNPLTGYIFDAFTKYGVVPEAIILDSKGMSKKDHKIHEERTGGFLFWRPFHTFTLGTPVYFVGSHQDASLIHLVDTLQLNLLVNGGTPRILKKSILDSTEFGVLNCHPGSLPNYRGCTCPEWAVFNNDYVFNTVHQMSEGVDEGPILAKECVDLCRLRTYQEVRTQVYLQGFDLLARVYKKLSDGSLSKKDFKEQSGGKYYEPIGNNKLVMVVDKIEKGLYNPREVNSR